MEKSEVTLRIHYCARCGESHEDVVARPLTRQVYYTHWAPCPVNGEPMLIVHERVKTEEDGRLDFFDPEKSIVR